MFTKVTDDSEKGSKLGQFLVGFAANLLIFTYGVQLGWMSPNIIILQGSSSPSGYPLSDNEITMIASIPCLVAVFFCIPYSLVIDRYGRKLGLILVAIPEAIGYMLKLISASFLCLLISQIVVGISWAGTFTVAPLYTKEIASDSIRGALGSFGMLLRSVGTMIIYALGAFFDYYTILWAILWIPIFNILLLLMVPETPPYLIKTRRDKEAGLVISKLNGVHVGHKYVKSVVEELRKAQEASDIMPKVTFKGMCEDIATRRAIYLGLFMISLLNMGGNFAIISYASVIITNSGVKINPLIQSLSIPIVMLIGSFLSSFTIEKFGRKRILIICLTFNGIPMLTLAALLILMKHGYSFPPWIAIVCVTVSIFAFGSGIVTIPYVVITEIFIFKIRAKIIGYYVSIGMLMCFLQNILFTPLSNAYGMYSVFIMFGVINLVCALICIKWMPETKGKSLEEIRRDLAK